jgi:hypothetical protein
MNDKNLIETHRKFAVEAFNKTWDLIDKTDRSQEEIDRMINLAHASRYHWEIAGEGVNIARGEWQISRVYAILKRAEPSLYHAKRCLEVTLKNKLKDFDLAFAYEAMARANCIAGNNIDQNKFIALAEEAGELISDQGDKDYFFSELSAISPG